MFDSSIYTKRRNQLRTMINNGAALFLGNNESPMNYPANTYHYRQDSSFLYFFGLDQPGLAGVIDFDSGEDYIFGDDVTIDDIVWMGPQPLIKDRALLAGVNNSMSYKMLDGFIKEASGKGRCVHYLSPYRADTIDELEQLLGLSHQEVKMKVSVELTKAVIALRSVKDEYEIAELNKAVDVAYDMHTKVMKMAYPGIYEYEIAGAVEGIALAGGGQVPFPVILSMDGQTLHNHYHGNKLVEGRMVVTDAGAETALHYASDITRTVPVGGKFLKRQQEIYEIVLQANVETIKNIKPGITNKNLHYLAAKIITDGLKDLGLMKGDTEEAVKQGAHALFFPHGLGHMLGLDVHDMEGLGEDYVGYDEKVKRSEQFGTAYLRLGKRLAPGYVLTIEPGIYFIPALIDMWKADKKYTDFINYDKVETYKDFGGIRIEDDVLVTETGNRVLGKPIPKIVEEVEGMMAR